MVSLLVIHFFLPFVFHVLLFHFIRAFESLSDRCDPWLAFLLDNPVLGAKEWRLVDLFNFIWGALFLFLTFLLAFFVFWIDHSVLLSNLEFFLQLHLFDGFIPLIWVHLLDCEDPLIREESILFLVLVPLRFLLLGATVVRMMRVEVVWLPRSRIQVWLLDSFWVHNSQCNRLNSWAMSIWIPVSLLQETQVDVKDLSNVVVLRVRLLLELGEELLGVWPDLGWAPRPDELLHSVPVFSVNSERI